MTWLYAGWLSGRRNASTLEDLRSVAGEAIAGLDHSLTIITGLLRIAEIEHSRRLERLSEARLGPLLREVGDLHGSLDLPIIQAICDKATMPKGNP